MDYQQARQIRNMPSLSDLIRREAVYGRQGVIGSVKEAVKQKFNIKRRLQASMLGVKEKLDPMNWARAVFGKTGAALYGRMMGRSEADIQYFAGRARPIAGRSYQIGETPKYRGYEQVTGSGEGGIGKRTIPILTDMYNFLKKTQDSETRRRELESNKREEFQLEDARRHKELMKAIKGISFGTSYAGKKTATKEEPSIFEGIKNFIQGMIDKALGAFAWIKDLKDYASDIINFFKIGGGFVKDLLKFIGSNLFRLFMANPALLALGSLALLAAYLIKNASPEANQATAEGLAQAADITAESRAIMATQEPTDENLVYKRKVRLLSERPSNKKSLLFWKDSELQKKYLDEIGFDEKTGLTRKEKESGFIGLDENATPIKKKSEDLTIRPAMPDETSAETARLMRQNAAAGEKVSSLSQENSSLRTEAKMAPPTPETVVQTQSMAAAKRPDEPKSKLPSVRNNEESFARMIYESTRVV